MLTLLACALTVAQVPIDQPQRLRTLLPNGSAILVEQTPKAKTLSVQLFVSARSGGTFGQRHLWEHLSAVGDGTLDSRLESEGAFLRPQTFRDATVFALQLPPSKLDLGLSALKEILAERSFSQEQIGREMKVLQQEGALREDTARMSETVWSKAYGAEGAGAFDVSGVTATQVKQLHQGSRSAENLVLVIAGDVDLDAATSKGKAFLAPFAKGTAVKAAPARKAVEGGSVSATAQGNALACPVPSFRSPATAAVLGAALAAATELPESYVIYTPSSQSGLVTLGSRSNVPVRDLVARMSAEDLFGRAKLLGKRWVNRQIASAAGAGFMRGLLLVQERDLRPETLRENLDAMTLEQFRAGLEALSGDTAVLALGRGPGALPETKEVDAPKVAETRGKSDVVELISPADDQIVLHALVQLPVLTPGERRTLDHVVRAIPRGTAEYPRREMLMISGGAPVEAVLAEDHVRITVSVPKGGLSGGISLMESLLARANLRDEDLAAVSAPADAWSLALDPVSYHVDRLPSDHAREIYQRVFRPDRVVLSVGGPISPGEAKSAWEKKTAAWQAPRQPLPRGDYSRISAFTGNLAGVTTIDIASQIGSRGANLYPKLLATFALGSGKGSSLFQVVRQDLGISYRQEALLVPTYSGLEARLLIAATPTADDAARVAEIRTALLKHIDNWTEDDRKRALGIASASMLEGTEVGPLYLSGKHPVPGDLSGRTFLAGYWPMKTGLEWDGALLLTNLKDVPLAELREAAKAIVNGTVRVLPG